MLTNKELGHAIKTALESIGLKGPTAVARAFNIAPPSAANWFATGRITKEKLLEIMDMCAEKHGPEHWGLTKWAGQRYPIPTGEQRPVAAHCGTVAYLARSDNPDIQAVVDMMLETDDKGRGMAMTAVRFALKDYHPAVKNHAG